MTKAVTISLAIFCSWFLTANPAFALTSKPPVLSVGSPREGDQILGDRLTVSFIVGNFTFVDYHQKKTKAPNEGHVDMFLDQDELILENANEVLSHDDVIFTHVPEGNHTLIIRLANNDHTSYKPPIEKTIHFTTHLPAPTSPSSPTPLPPLSFFSQQVTREQILVVDGIVLFIIGFIVFLIFGRKKFIK